jgi:hypothetical protein
MKPMSHFMLRSATAALCLAFLPAMAAPPTPRVEQEVRSLLDAIGTSPCQFQRNRSWYDGAEARAHLQKKYDYLVAKNLVTTTEEFIERGATSSSISGTAYQIRCPGAAAVDSAVWLKQKLGTLRRQGGAAS